MQFDLFSHATRIASAIEPVPSPIRTAKPNGLHPDLSITDGDARESDLDEDVLDASDSEVDASPRTETAGSPLVSRTAVTPDGREACERGRATDDAGEVLLGSRKERYRQALVLADLCELTGAQKVEQVVKDRVWPVPDYADLAERGRAPRVLALIKIARDSLAARPRVQKAEPFDRSATLYVTILAELQERLASADTIEAVIAAARAVHERYTRNGLAAICAGRCSPLILASRDVAKADRLIAAGFPGSIETWKRGYTVKRWNGTDPVEFALYRGRRWVGRTYPSEADAWAALKSTLDAQRPGKTSDGPRMPEFPHLTRLERTGPTHPEGVTSQDFKNTFGFRGVQFGIWLAERERQSVLDHAYAGLMDLAEVVGIAPRHLALGGRRPESARKVLGLAFGARGRGGRTQAHYEPGEVVLNMTKFTGAGRVAHEYWHALDHWLGLIGHPDEVEMGQARFASGGDVHRRDRRSALPDLPSALVDALIELIQACTQSTPTLEAATRSVERQHAHLLASLRRAQDEHAALTARARTPKRLRDIESDLSSTRMALEMIEQRAESLARGVMPAALIGSESSRYMRQARILDPKSKAYWSTPCELTARAFEAWVLDTLAEQGRKSQYLVHSADEGLFAPPFYKADPFPTGDERRRINAAFDIVVPLIARTIEARAI